MKRVIIAILLLFVFIDDVIVDLPNVALQSRAQASINQSRDGKAAKPPQIQGIAKSNDDDDYTELEQRHSPKPNHHTPKIIPKVDETIFYIAGCGQRAHHEANHGLIAFLRGKNEATSKERAMIREYLTAGYPALWMLTQEPHRAEEILAKESDGKCEAYAWDCLRGIRKAATLKVEEQAFDPTVTMNWLSDQQDTILFAHNLHMFMEIPEVKQAIQNGVQVWKSKGNCLCAISPSINLPPEVEKFFFVIDFPLPDEERLEQIQTELSQMDGVYVNVNPIATAAAKGLTEFEAETAFAFSLATKNEFDPRIVSNAKAQMIKKSGTLQFWPPEDPNTLGGLGLFKKWFEPRLEAFQPDSKKPPPRAILFAGVAGCGKSLTAKVLANMIQWDLIRFDLTAMKNQFVGETERKTREAWRIAEAFGRVVIWIDEIEKIFGGSGSNQQTGDTSTSMLSILLTNMQESKAQILLAATANRAYTLPAELLRRFDEIFFVDTPTLPERREIIAIMNKKWNVKIPIEWASKLDGYTGAEIEKLARSCIFESYETAIKRIVPVTKSGKSDVEAIRAWAQGGATPANTPDDEGSVEGRKLKLA
jgi:hypothetical protein